jgi:serine/threonine protein kinase
VEPISADDPVAVGGFRLRARLGAGGMGQVYLGTSAGGRAVAVKVVRPELAQDAEFIRRFRHEVEAARRVSGAFTAPVIAADLDAKPPWLATAFVPGPSLQDWVDESGPLPEAAVRRLAAGLAEALSAVHACGLVHRDLKPSNVLLAEDGPRVIDFGISRARYGSAVTVPGYVVGTPPFMSPEQARGNPVGPASDIFSLGAVLCMAATGRPPFGDDNPVVVLYRMVHEPPALDGIPASLGDLVARCLTKDPAGRPRPAELMRALADGGDGSRIAAGSFWPPEVAQRVRDFRARLDEDLPEPVFVAPATPPTRFDPAARPPPSGPPPPRPPPPRPPPRRPLSLPVPTSPPRPTP